MIYLKKFLINKISDINKRKEKRSMSLSNNINTIKLQTRTSSSNLPNFKLNIIFTLTIILQLFSNTFSAECRRDRWCMACSSTTENKCDACFNWGYSVNFPRAINASNTPQDCITPLSLTVFGCKFYSGLETTAATNRSLTTCNICQREFLYWESVNSIMHCTDILPFGQKRIDNCDTTVQFETAGNAITTGCRMCNKNFSGSGWDTVNGAGSTHCVKNRAINNCEFNYMLSDSSYECYSCVKDYAVSSTKTTCISFTVDPNCRSQHAGTEGCYYCWHAYYWDSYICILDSQIHMKLLWSLGLIFVIFNIFWV